MVKRIVLQQYIDLDGHEFYSVIPNICEGSYTISALFQISHFGRDVKLKYIISVYY